MKPVLIVALIGLIASTLHRADAQVKQTFTAKNKFSLGVFAGESGYDSGIGLEIGSPSFFRNRFCFRVRGNLAWLEQYKAEYDHWASYKALNSSVVYHALTVEHGRLYFDLGMFLFFPDKKFSEVKSLLGISCASGVELFVIRESILHVSYYFSGGVNFVRAYAEKLEKNPRYGNGFVFNNGLRFYF